MHPVRASILQAAAKRFAGYGPSKTTMAEIARDCGMSVGNLYRHFANKQAIMLACLEQHLQEKLEAGIAAARARDEPLDALHAFLHTRLRIAHAQLTDARHLFELVEAIESRHRDTLLRYERQVIEALAEILERGVTQGRFAVADTRQTAYDIHQATLRYNHPLFLRQHELDVLERDLARLVRLLDVGLQRR